MTSCVPRTRARRPRRLGSSGPPTGDEEGDMRVVYGVVVSKRQRRRCSLVESLTKEEIPLPPPPCNFKCGFNKSSTSCVDKVVLSSNPSSSSSSQQPRGCCTVMAIRKCARALSFCRIGDDGGSWTTFEETRTFVICYRGRFYAATSGSGFVMLDVNSPSPKMPAAAEDCYWIDEDRVDDVHVEYGYQDYLVESSGELLMVSRVTKEITDAVKLDYTKSTAKFVVHKLDFDTRTWSRVVSLGDQALFRSSSSVSVAAAAATDTGHGYKRNCIYFLNVDGFVCCCRCTGSSDMGVFDLEDGSSTPFGIDMELHYYPQFWIDLAVLDRSCSMVAILSHELSEVRVL